MTNAPNRGGVPKAVETDKPAVKMAPMWAAPLSNTVSWSREAPKYQKMHAMIAPNLQQLQPDPVASHWERGNVEAQFVLTLQVYPGKACSLPNSMSNCLSILLFGVLLTHGTNFKNMAVVCDKAFFSGTVGFDIVEPTLGIPSLARRLQQSLNCPPCLLAAPLKVDQKNSCPPENHLNL